MPKQLEKEIQDACINRLDIWKLLNKVVIHYENMSAHGKKFIRGRWVMHSNKGSPDLVAYIKHKTNCCIMFFEIKRPGGVQSAEQLAFMLKFRNLSNVYYYLINDPKQIDFHIENVTGYYEDKLASMPEEL